jgi:hypothetical protein
MIYKSAFQRLKGVRKVEQKYFCEAIEKLSEAKVK